MKIHLSLTRDQIHITNHNNFYTYNLKMWLSFSYIFISCTIFKHRTQNIHLRMIYVVYEIMWYWFCYTKTFFQYWYIKHRCRHYFYLISFLILKMSKWTKNLKTTFIRKMWFWKPLFQKGFKTVVFKTTFPKSGLQNHIPKVFSERPFTFLCTFR